MKLQAKLRLTIGTKLVGLIGVLLVGSIISLIWLSTHLFIDDNTALIQQVNADTAAGLATQMREVFENTTEKMRILGIVLAQTYSNPANRDQVIREFFVKDKEFLSVFLYKAALDGTFSIAAKATSPELSTTGDPGGAKLLAAVAADKDLSMNLVGQGEVHVSVVHLPDSTPGLALAIPFIEAPRSRVRFSYTLLAVIRQTRFVNAFGDNAIITSFMVDNRGKLLAHPDANLVSAGENFSYLQIVKEALAGKFNNGQTRYPDPTTHVMLLGAFHSVGFGGLSVVAQVPEAKASEAAHRVVVRSIWAAIVILCLSFLAGYLYSGTITWPIRQLVMAAQRISQGDFKINLKPKGKDEIAHLSASFNEMAQGLEERDRVKETFNKFHNKEIAEKLLSGEVKLGGERKEATVFFSDVRGFTALSESMQPEQVVEMLNEYMTRMVAIIRSYGGVVDKYVGDAIMALWGVPISQPDDPIRAVRACIAMREDLTKLNELRISRGQPVLKIGMGVNTGPLIAGNIGSVEKMEYTVIGDAVNLASRIESMTKEYGTDLLVSNRVYEQVQAGFIFEKCKSSKVKGKSEAIQIYKVLGYYDEAGNPVIVQTPYSTYAAEKSEKVVHDPAPESHPGEAPAESLIPPIIPPPPPFGRDETTQFILKPPEAPAAEVTTEITRTDLVRPIDPPPAPAVEEAPTVWEIPAPEPVQEPVEEPATETSAPSPRERPALFRRKNWYFRVGDEVFGPFTRQEIFDGLTQGELATGLEVSGSPEGPWVLMRDHSELRGVVLEAEEKLRKLAA